jgi:hypothetical protein
MRRTSSLTVIAVGLVLAACSSHDPATAPGGSSGSITLNPCSASGTVQLAVAQTTRVDCSNGGTTVTLAGGGASYLVVAQFAVDLVPDALVQYHVSSGNAASASLVPVNSGLSLLRTSTSIATSSKSLPPMRPRAKQLAFERALRARARQSVASGRFTRSPSLSRSLSVAQPVRNETVPAVGSVRGFQVLANDAGTSYASVGARLAYAGSDVLIYIDTLAPANGFSDAQLQAFGKLFDQTLYPLDTAAFGPPTDVDANAHVIMLMTPAVNQLSPSAECQTQGYVAGFFDEEDLGAPSTDPHSNQGEIFYSIVPDPNGTTSCSHSVDDVGFDVPGTFMHELQHLISFSQHVVVHGGNPEYGWLDEGLSIVSEEIGSLYYENKCPGTSCRSDPSQVFPDSSQGFISNFLYDSYQYALLPDTASVTLHDDSENGFSWRGGDWLLMRYLGDQLGTGLYKKLDQNTRTGVANIENSTGQSFPTLFANFGLALYTDSLPGLARTTAPSVNRFTTRNLRQLWFRLFQTSSGSDVPLPFPLRLFAISSDTSTSVMDPGTGSYFRLDTPTSSSTVTIQFSAPHGSALAASLKPQLAIFRLPAGQ